LADQLSTIPKVPMINKISIIYNEAGREKEFSLNKIQTRIGAIS